MMVKITIPACCTYGLTVLAILLTMTQRGWAQCGSVGDPIVNITFGTASNPDIGRGTTTYTLRSNGSLNDGEYKLASNVSQGRPEWHNLGNHTPGQPDGLMLVVNASHAAGEFYRIRVTGLCHDTRFRFSAMIANANQPDNCGENTILPNVRFVIEGRYGNVVNNPYATGNIPTTSSPVWQEYGFEFDTGGETEFDLVLINDNPGGCGNDLAIDDIQFRPCGPLLALEPFWLRTQADSLFFCEGEVDPIVIGSRVSSGSGYPATPVFQWQSRAGSEDTWQDMPGERGSSLTFIPIHDQWYRLTAAATEANLGNQLCRITSDAIRIAQVAPLSATLVSQVLDALCVHESVSFSPPGHSRENAGPVAYQWLLDEGNGLAPIPGATTGEYRFDAGAQTRSVVLLREVTNICGERIITHEYAFDVREIVRAAFTLAELTSCADDEPILLTAGTLLNPEAGMVGVYSGNGVSDGFFDPRLAGVGEHTITYSAPPDVRCAVPAQVVMTVFDSVSMSPMLPMVMLAGQRVTLRPETNAIRFQWDNQPGLDDYRVLNPVASPTETTTYTLRASNEHGCSKEVSVTVNVLRNLQVPNGFTPNGDGINDGWEIAGLEQYPNVFIQVFNRWGAPVFSSKGYPTPWNGQFNGAPLPAGTYYYTIASDVLRQPLSGSVSILR